LSEHDVRASRAGSVGGVPGHGEADGDAVGAAGVVCVRVCVHRTVFRKHHARELRDAGADVAGARCVGAVGEGGDFVEEGGDDGHLARESHVGDICTGNITTDDFLLCYIKHLSIRSMSTIEEFQYLFERCTNGITVPSNLDNRFQVYFIMNTMKNDALKAMKVYPNLDYLPKQLEPIVSAAYGNIQYLCKSKLVNEDDTDVVIAEASIENIAIAVSNMRQELNRVAEQTDRDGLNHLFEICLDKFEHPDARPSQHKSPYDFKKVYQTMTTMKNQGLQTIEKKDLTLNEVLRDLSNTILQHGV
jgi:hypothetical protein